MRRLALALLTLASVRSVRGEVPGGGLPDADCRVVFEGVSATSGASGVVCTDGDPACDADGAADGSCRLTVRVCIGTASAVCAPVPLSTITVTGLSLAPPPLPAADGTCGDPLTVDLPVGTPAGATLLARGGGELRDVDYLNLCCVAAAAPLDPARCAVGIDLALSGCSTHRLPHRARSAFARARALVTALDRDPSRTTVRQRAEARLAAVQKIAHRLAARDPCGDTLGLIASHARAALADTGGASPP